MSILLTTTEDISRSCVNNSPSKQLYTFTKEKRFRVPSPYHNRISYNAKSDFGHSNFVCQVPTTFGVKRPSLFYDKEKAYKPSPNKYTLGTSFRSVGSRRSSHGDLRAQSARVSSAFSMFGAERESYNKVVSHKRHNYQEHDPSNPGPSHYRPSQKEMKD